MGISKGPEFIGSDDAEKEISEEPETQELKEKFKAIPDEKNQMNNQIPPEKNPDERRFDDLLKIQKTKERLGLPANSEKEEMLKRLSNTIEHMSETLNDADCNYYITGGIVAYVVANEPFNREHSDIDVIIPESQVKTAQEALKSHGFEFWDERYAHRDRERKDLEGRGGHHNYGARDKETGVRIGFYTFQETEDGKIVMVDIYGERDKNGKLIEKTEETVFPSGIQKEDLLDLKKYPFGKSKVGIVTPEYIYLRKKAALRPKDISDAELLKKSGHLDTSRLERLEEQLPNIKRREVIGKQRKEITPMEELSEKVSDTLLDVFEEMDISESDGATMVETLLKNPKIKEASEKRPLVKDILERIRKIPLQNKEDFIKSAIASIQDIELKEL
jgi:hypothetical protein